MRTVLTLGWLLAAALVLWPFSLVLALAFLVWYTLPRAKP